MTIITSQNLLRTISLRMAGGCPSFGSGLHIDNAMQSMTNRNTEERDFQTFLQSLMNKEGAMWNNEFKKIVEESKNFRLSEGPATIALTPQEKEFYMALLML
mmetsp:Transcript_31708/g.67196  ORF Transcript_31708/g.67196 Transcript_31708/m.67196 type:complete len:102 (+) Transcript_31708:111-416(+)